MALQPFFYYYFLLPTAMFRYLRINLTNIHLVSHPRRYNNPIDVGEFKRNLWQMKSLFQNYTWQHMKSFIAKRVYPFWQILDI